MKRILDVCAAALGLLLLSPVLLVIAGIIKWHDGGPVFYRALRVGKDTRLFWLYKFRSMVIHANKHGAGITAQGDTRITPIGRLLRRTKLDELPQLFNVLKGEMSLVGPRPEDPRYVALYTRDQHAVLAVPPGITSAASLSYRHEEQLLSGPNWEEIYRTRVMPEKLAIDLDYLQHRTLGSDLQLILRTVLSMAR